ncbi:MAG: hypothetical protein HQL47_10690, partial [Gammaproteobacteria bacterium]|nr:hypothetical protein [Gammaproteobacteria bacterium]
SPAPWLAPAIGQFGQGEQASISPDCWPLLHAGRYYARLGQAQGRAGLPYLWRFDKA